jgi:hypothetical protein
MTVGADRLELPPHQAAGALADRDHRGHRGNADDHAQHGQPRAELVLCQGAKGDAEGEEETHRSNSKSEIRSTKQIQSSNAEMTKTSKLFGFMHLTFVLSACFGFRISDFVLGLPFTVQTRRPLAGFQ